MTKCRCGSVHPCCLTMVPCILACQRRCIIFQGRLCTEPPCSRHISGRQLRHLSGLRRLTRDHSWGHICMELPRRRHTSGLRLRQISGLRRLTRDLSRCRTQATSFGRLPCRRPCHRRCHHHNGILRHSGLLRYLGSYRSHLCPRPRCLGRCHMQPPLPCCHRHITIFKAYLHRLNIRAEVIKVRR